jgi:NAD(P)-dependent dehydrogenase (short-subunit alcohol dehydrogenase family)
MWDKQHPHYNTASKSAKGVESLMGRIGEPTEVAAAVAYLCSNDASYVTGENHLGKIVILLLIKPSRVFSGRWCGLPHLISIVL